MLPSWPHHVTVIAPSPYHHGAITLPSRGHHLTVMAPSRYHHGSIMLLSWPHLTAMATSSYHYGPIILPSWPHHLSIIAPSSYRHGPIILSSWPHHVTVMLPLWGHHPTITVPSSYCHGPIILPSCYHHSPIMLLSWPHHVTVMTPSSYCHGPIILLSWPHHLTITAPSSYHHGQSSASVRPGRSQTPALSRCPTASAGCAAAGWRRRFWGTTSVSRACASLQRQARFQPSARHSSLGPSSSLTHARLVTLIDGGWRVSGTEQKHLLSFSKAKIKHESQSVAQSKNTHSRKPKLSSIKCGHRMDGWLLRARLCTHPEISPRFLQNQILCRLYKPLSPMSKDHIHKLKILSTLSEFGGLRKHQNNPACTKSVRVIRMLNSGHYMEGKKENKISVTEYAVL